MSESEVEQLFREYFNEQANNGTPLQIAAKIVNKLTYDISPVEFRTLLGVNNIWADCGTVEVTYNADATLSYAQLDQDASSVPASASVSNAGVLSFSNSVGTQLFSVQLPLYTGGVD